MHFNQTDDNLVQSKYVVEKLDLLQRIIVL
jgi:hypothetical protein